MNDSQLMNKKSSCIFEILTQQHIGLLIKHITLCRIYISTCSRAFFLITWTTISRKEGSSLCSRFTALPSQRLARKSTLFLFHFYVFCRRCCPCTMVHVISGEWSSPDAYTNSFSAFSPLPPLLFFTPVEFLSTFSSLSCAFPQTPSGVATMRRRGFVIVPRDRKSDAKAVAKADRSNTLMRLRGPSLSPSYHFFSGPSVSRLFRPPAKISSFRVARCGM